MKKYTSVNSLIILFLAVILFSCKEEIAKTTQTVQPVSLSYSFEFDSMQKAIAHGWQSINLSNPNNGGGWREGSYVVKYSVVSNIPAHSYKASSNEYAHCHYTVGAGSSYINCWLVTPPLMMKNNDVFSFWTRTVSAPVSFPDRLQVWINPVNDGVNVGRNENETGDFTMLVTDINPNLSAAAYPTGYPNTWTKYEFTITNLPNGNTPQKRRIGFRYYVRDGGTGGNNSDEIGIDDFVFTSR